MENQMINLISKSSADFLKISKANFVVGRISRKTMNQWLRNFPFGFQTLFGEKTCTFSSPEKVRDKIPDLSHVQDHSHPRQLLVSVQPRGFHVRKVLVTQKYLQLHSNNVIDKRDSDIRVSCVTFIKKSITTERDEFL